MIQKYVRRGVFLNFDSYNVIMMKFIVVDFALVFNSMDTNASFLIFVDEIKLDKSPALGVSQSIQFDAVCQIFRYCIFHYHWARVFNMNSDLTLLELIVQNLAFIAGHHCDARLLGFIDDIIFNCAFKWAYQNDWLHAVIENAVLNDNWCLAVSYSQNSDSSMLKITLPNNDFASLQQNTDRSHSPSHLAPTHNKGTLFLHYNWGY